MRKAQKQQVEDLLGQMKEAQGQIKKYIGQGNIPQAMELLEDCQNGAITIGTLIENTEYEGHPTVSLLEAYCELIYRIYQKLEENNKEINTDKCDKQLRQKLLKVVNSVKNDISVRQQMVFFPYKRYWLQAGVSQNSSSIIFKIFWAALYFSFLMASS